MSDADKVFAGSIPEIYDQYLVPLIFEGFAQDLAQRVIADKPLAVLETAAGSGVLGLALILAILSFRRRSAEGEVVTAISRFLEDDPAPVFTTNGEGRIGYQNVAARDRFGPGDADGLLEALSGSFAAPASVLGRLQMQADARGTAPCPKRRSLR